MSNGLSIRSQTDAAGQSTTSIGLGLGFSVAVGFLFVYFAIGIGTLSALIENGQLLVIILAVGVVLWMLRPR